MRRSSLANGSFKINYHHMLAGGVPKYISRLRVAMENAFQVNSLLKATVYHGGRICGMAE